MKTYKTLKTAIRIIAAGLAASLALVSCAKQDAMDNGGTSPADGARVITVSFANNSTKSTLDGFQPKFAEGDVIKISDGTTAVDCEVEIDGDVATISTTLTDDLIMVYPSTAAKMNGNAIEGIKVSTVQDGTFASANICKATIVAGATLASFENQTAVFKLSVPAKQDEKGADYVVKSLAVISRGENDIADGSKEITVGDGTSPVTADENGFYYVSLLPGETASNLTVCAGAGARNLTRNVVIAENDFYSVALPVLNGHEYVELTMNVGGEDKIYKWATVNVGANTIKDRGWFFFWAGTTGYEPRDYGASGNPRPCRWVKAEDGTELPGGFNWSNTPFNNGSSSYDATYFNSVKDTVCPGGILALDYDAAHVNWGGTWRMPTKEEIDALATLPQTWVVHKGLSFGTPPAQFSLNLAGAGLDATFTNVDYHAYYWTSSLLLSNPSKAYYLYFYQGDKHTNTPPCLDIERYRGRTVRALSE